ncbi:MAG: 2-C-methyl-D-erythritol 2,4-cyclodiphosphate synthase [Thermodesulfobacteriota bacterium]
MRVGQGFDAHRFADGRKLVLGGVEIDHHRGLEGHSDADVLTHAIIDALLGAAGLGDIGMHFPDTDPAYKDASSIGLFKIVCEAIEDLGYHIVNVDATIVAEEPRLSRYKPAMVASIASAAAIEPEQVNVKATTTERMGFAGRGEGIAAFCVILLERGRQR